MEEPKLNDGGGLFDSIGLIDTLIVDCNEIPKLLLSGKYILFCGKVVEMVQKLSQLKKGVDADTKDLQRQIDHLRDALDNLTGEKGE